MVTSTSVPGGFEAKIGPRRHSGRSSREALYPTSQLSRGGKTGKASVEPTSQHCGRKHVVHTQQWQQKKNDVKGARHAKPDCRRSFLHSDDGRQSELLQAAAKLCFAATCVVLQLVPFHLKNARLMKVEPAPSISINKGKFNMPCHTVTWQLAGIWCQHQTTSKTCSQEHLTRIYASE